MIRIGDQTGGESDVSRREVAMNCESTPDGRRGRIRRLMAIGVLTSVAGLLYWFYFSIDASEKLVRDGRLALSHRDFSLAIASAERALSQSQKLAIAWKLLAEAAGQSDQVDRSLEALEEYSQLNPDDAGKLGIHLGSLWMRRNFVRPAKRAFEISERLSVRVKFSLQMQEQIAAVTGHSRETVRCILELIKRDTFTKGDMLLITALVPRLADKNRLEAILQADPAYKSPLLAKTFDELYLKHIDVAERMLTEITVADPGDLEAQGALADLYARFLPEKFLAWHSHLPPAAVDDARIWAARGKWLSASGKTQSAIRCLHEALIREPEQLSTTVLIGQLLKVQNEPELGNAFLERGRRMQTIVDLNERLVEPRAA
jgi:tetratricopeptide (TPR) repeat protein